MTAPSQEQQQAPSSSNAWPALFILLLIVVFVPAARDLLGALLGVFWGIGGFLVGGGFLAALFLTGRRRK